MSRRIFAALAFLFCVSTVANEARADDAHYQDYVVGGRALVLGGAFASLADDASGVYYNPAGLADVEHSSLQLSASLYGFERGTIDDRLALPVPGVEDLDIEFTDLVVIPASAGFVKAMGARGNDGLPKHAYGLSVVVPSFRSFSASSVGEGELYKRRVNDRELWSGLGYGVKLGRRLRLGISAFYILRSVVDLEDVTVQEEVAGGDRFQSVINDISLTIGSFVFIGGLKYLLSDRITLGLTFQSPSVQVHSQANLRFSRAVADPTGTPTTSELDRLTLTDVAAQSRYAPALRVGINYSETYRFTLAMDASFHLPVDYTLVEVDEQYRARLPFNPQIERRAVANFNLGAEYLVVRDVSVGVGMFTDFASSAPIPEEPRADQPPHVHLLGLTMALGYFGQHSLSRLGVVYSFGQGRDVIPVSDVDRAVNEAQSFRRVDYTQSFFYVFVSSTFRY